MIFIKFIFQSVCLQDWWTYAGSSLVIVYPSGLRTWSWTPSNYSTLYHLYITGCICEATTSKIPKTFDKLLKMLVSFKVFHGSSSIRTTFLHSTSVCDSSSFSFCCGCFHGGFNIAILSSIDFLFNFWLWFIAKVKIAAISGCPDFATIKHFS